MKITLCISVPNDSEKMFALAVRTAAALASGNHQIDIHCTCHGEEQHRRISAEDIPLPITAVHYIEREPNTYPHAYSVIHSRCVNALYRGADADIAVICDYDGVFAMRNWDEVLADALVTRGIAFFGSPYSSQMAHGTQIGNSKIYAMKYQAKPNCIFLAYQPARIRALSADICDFSTHFNSPESYAVKLVSNPAESRTYRLPVGAFVSLDTGSLLPALIEQHQLPWQALTRQTDSYQVLRFTAPAAEGKSPKDSTLLPEEYLIDGQPFFIHYRKGVRKGEKPAHQMGYGQEEFARDINAWLQRLQNVKAN